jgi:hypothetical protein
MLDSGGKSRVKKTLQPHSGSADPTIFLARILAPWLWGMVKMGLFVDSSQQPLLTEGGVESSWGNNIIGLR